MRLLRLGVVAIGAAIVAVVAGGRPAPASPRAARASGVGFGVVRVAMPSVSEVAAVPDGGIWFDAAGAAGDVAFGRRGRTGLITYADPAFGVQEARPDRLAVDRNGDLWTVLRAPAGAAVARIHPDGSSADTYTVPACTGCRPTAIAASADGTIWVGESGAAIYALSAAGALLRSVTPETSALAPDTVVAALAPTADGSIWFSATARVGRIAPDGTVVDVHEGFGPGVVVGDLVAAPDGSAWFTLTDAVGTRLARLTQAGAMTQYAQGLPAGARPARLAVAPDGTVWFTDTAAARVGRISAGGAIDLFRLPAPAAAPGVGIVVAADGKVWIAVPSASSLVSVAPVVVSGAVSLVRTLPVVAGKLRVELACAAAACKGALTVRVRSRAAARATFSIPQQRHGIVVLTLDPPTRAALRANRRVAATLVLAPDGRAPLARAITLRS